MMSLSDLNGFDTNDKNVIMHQSSSEKPPEGKTRQAYIHSCYSGDARPVGCGGYAFASDLPRMQLVEESEKKQHLGRVLQNGLRCSVEEHEDAVKIMVMQLKEELKKKEMVIMQLEEELKKKETYAVFERKMEKKRLQEQMERMLLQLNHWTTKALDTNDKNCLMPQSLTKTPPRKKLLQAKENDDTVAICAVYRPLIVWEGHEDAVENDHHLTWPLTPSKGRNHYISIMDLFPNKQVSPEESEASPEESEVSPEESEDDSDDNFDVVDIRCDPELLRKEYEKTMNSKEYLEAIDTLMNEMRRQPQKGSKK